MSYPVLEKKREYIEAAATEVEKELSDSIQKALVSVEVNFLLNDYVELVDETYDVDDRVLLLAGKVPDEEWEREYQKLDMLFEREEALGQRLVRLGEQLVARGYELPDLKRLRDQAQRVHDCLNWPEDYADTPKFREMLSEAERECLAGECEEGGWDVSEDNLREVE